MDPFSTFPIFSYLLIIPVWFYFRYGNLIPSFQSLQLGAALGLVRLALIVGLISQPLTGTNLAEDVVNRQVRHSESRFNLQEIKIACLKTGMSFTKYIWLPCSPTQGILKEFYISLFFSRNIYCVIQNTSAQ